MIQVTLVGGETCHRYQLMRDMVLEEAARLGVPIQLIEENEVQGILKYNTVNLPILFIGAEKIAQGNPPHRELVQENLLRRERT